LKGWCYCSCLIPEWGGQIEYFNGSTKDDLNNFQYLVECGNNNVACVKGTWISFKNNLVEFNRKDSTTSYHSEDNSSIQEKMQETISRKKGASVNEVGYGTANSILKEISKCNDVDWERIELFLKGVMHETMARDAATIDEKMATIEYSLVSSHAPKEKSPNRLRVKAF
jgi:hypothetical protein